MEKSPKENLEKAIEFVQFASSKGLSAENGRTSADHANDYGLGLLTGQGHQLVERLLTQLKSKI
ncbi:MAG: hypothetical protein MK033_10910 [Candidatus Caenarcaniphilales bacterium]|nr:hypothetical protein [Candidatus Caenarcaniphilales bacterium]